MTTSWTVPRAADIYGRIAGLMLLEGRGRVERGHARAAQLLLTIAATSRPHAARARLELGKLRRRPDGAVLGSVCLGTTGVCNASCIHCPTGKPSTSGSPRETMPLELSARIVDGVADQRLSIRHMVAFGLFGDGLLDPFVVERAAYVRRRLPDVLLSVNTNGAAFNPTKHSALRSHVSIVALHCESLQPETFDTLMAPLRLKNLIPKYEAILRTFPGQVNVSVPVTRRNIDEVGAIRAWFLARGALDVVFDPLSSRCAENRGTFDSLALSPQPIRCGPDAATDLIVDCDGLVLACCQDFARREPLGDLSRQTFSEVLSSVQRRRFAEWLTDGRHDEIATCANCYADVRTPAFPFDTLPALA